LVFKLESGEQASLWSISVRGGEPVRLLSDCCAENHVRIHPDGRRLAFASGRDRGEVWILKMPGRSGLQRPRE
ncbi:MAG TPA: hypothetical protein VMM17_12985, partial [Gemmatimonadaceae bacterium]|nr:hypothetical protein [Gemmatimonadaceae bacterium]